MKKRIITALFGLFCVSANADIIIDADACRDRAEIKPQNDYNSYAGVRVYQNVHTTYDFYVPGQSHTRRNKDNMGFGTTMGFRFNRFLRGEYETMYMGAQYSAGSQNFEYDIWANMFNGYLYWNLHNVVAPYVGGGVGLTAMWGAVDGELANATDLSYQGLIGVLFELGNRVELETGLKYIDFGKIHHNNGTTHVDALQFYLGAIYRFGV